jgi:hypothetical protein
MREIRQGFFTHALMQEERGAIPSLATLSQGLRPIQWIRGDNPHLVPLGNFHLGRLGMAVDGLIHFEPQPQIFDGSTHYRARKIRTDEAQGARRQMVSGFHADFLPRVGCGWSNASHRPDKTHSVRLKKLNSYAEAKETTWFKSSLRLEEPLDSFADLAETSKLGKLKNPPRTCPDGEGHWVEYEKGLVLFHPDLGAAPLLGAFAAAWKSEQGSANPLGYPLRGPEKVPRKPSQRWQEFENGVLFGKPEGQVHAVPPEPLGAGSLSLEAVSQLAREWLHRIVSENPGSLVTQEPECVSLLDFERRDTTLAPRGHAFQFQAAYEANLLPVIHVTIHCDIRWICEPGKTEIQAYLDDYRYTLEAPRALGWAISQKTLDEKAQALVSPWLHQPQTVVESKQPLLCIKVLPDGGLYLYSIPG